MYVYTYIHEYMCLGVIPGEKAVPLNTTINHLVRLNTTLQCANYSSLAATNLKMKRFALKLPIYINLHM